MPTNDLRIASEFMPNRFDSLLWGLRGSVKCYDLFPLLAGHKFVLVSRISNEYGTETLIFPCDSSGCVLSGFELEGSKTGFFTHEEVLRALNYVVLPL